MLAESYLKSQQRSTHPYWRTDTMNIKAKLFTSAVAVAICASGVFAANVFASQSDNNQNSKNPELQKLAQYYENDRNNNNRSNYRKDRNNNNHPRSFSRLPNGYRRFVSQDKTYYTQNNQAYYSYSSASRAYVLINLPGFSIFF
jgi:Ni/Co efflux regulator RcnB